MKEKILRRKIVSGKKLGEKQVESEMVISLFSVEVEGRKDTYLLGLNKHLSLKIQHFDFSP